MRERMLSRDSCSQATCSAFTAPQVKRDRYFKTLRKDITNGAAYPVSSIFEMGNKIYNSVDSPNCSFAVLLVGSINEVELLE